MASADQLEVFLGETLVGLLSRDASDTRMFRYDAGWLKTGFAISASLPLSAAEHPGGGAFFDNLLPEGEVRVLVARRLGVSPGNDFELLRALGGDCAGALSLGEPALSEHDYEPLSERDLAQWMDEGTPALSQTAARAGTRLSLAGAQDKLPVYLDAAGDFFLPRGQAASTHILKLDNPRFKHLADNELLTTRFAAALALPTCPVTVRAVAGRQVFLIERYDREVRDDGRVHRLHQEDLCQALGLPPTRKYQSEGGPSFDACYLAVQEHSRDPLPDAQALIDWMIFCAVAGNADGHAKNLSLVRTREGGWRLSPFYDLVCTGAYPRLAKNLAMSVGQTSDPGFIRGQDWAELARRIQATPRFVQRRVGEVLSRSQDAFDNALQQVREERRDTPAIQRVSTCVRKNMRSLKARLPE